VSDQEIFFACDTHNCGYRVAGTSPDGPPPLSILCDLCGAPMRLVDSEVEREELIADRERARAEGRTMIDLKPGDRSHPATTVPPERFN
jgi:hypothetical protein